MPLIPYEPFRELNQWRKDLERLFQGGFGFAHEYTPRIDVHATDGEVVATCEIPGLASQEDVNIVVDDNLLTIHGAINRQADVKDEDMYRRERFVGRFERQISLPARVQSEGTTATYKDGILEVRMPKFKGESPQRINIKFH